MLRDHLGRFSTETKAKLAWIGKMLFIGMVVALLGSMILELGIYSLANKVAEAYTSGFSQTLK